MKKITGGTPIYNCPDYVKQGDFMVVRESDGELWFYGDYTNDIDRAHNVAKEVGGIVVFAMGVIG
jgi:hypothetical protein